jgi:hypothetical protein
MFDEPDEPKAEAAADPAERAREKSDEFRMHAEFAAVYEGHRKFEAAIMPNLEATLAREIQRTIGRLEKSKHPGSPILPPPSLPTRPPCSRCPRPNICRPTTITSTAAPAR